MHIDFRADATDLRAFLVDSVAEYTAKHDAVATAKRYPPVTRIDFNYWLTDGGPAAPFILLHFDTRAGSNPDGRWSHSEFASIKRPHWKAPLRAVLNGQDVEVVNIDGSKHRLKAAELEKVFGDFLVTVLKSARADKVFETLPKGERCELGVEESGGSFGWPVFKNRGKDNLV